MLHLRSEHWLLKTRSKFSNAIQNNWNTRLKILKRFFFLLNSSFQLKKDVAFYLLFRLEEEVVIVEIQSRVCAKTTTTTTCAQTQNGSRFHVFAKTLFIF